MGDHSEVLQLDFDPSLLSYEELLELIWAEHDPSAPQRSVQYRAVILAAGPEQLRQAEASKARQRDRLGRPVTTVIEPLGSFTRAEDYHQKYRLRRWSELRAELLELCGSERAFVDSQAAARLNGYLAGHGASQGLEAEVAAMGLRPETASAIVERVQARAR